MYMASALRRHWRARPSPLTHRSKAVANWWAETPLYEPNSRFKPSRDFIAEPMSGQPVRRFKKTPIGRAPNRAFVALHLESCPVSVDERAHLQRLHAQPMAI